MKLLCLLMLALVSTACGAQSEKSETIKPACWKFPWEAENCNCHGDNYTIAKIGKEYQCVDSSQGNLCQSMENGFSYILKNLGEEAFQRCLILASQKQSSLPLYNPNYVIDLKNVPLSEKKQFAAWADRNTAILANLTSWPSAGLAGEFLTVAAKPSDTIMASVLLPFEMPNQIVDYIYTTPAPKVFDSVESLEEFLMSPFEKSILAAEKFSFDKRAQDLVEAYLRPSMQSFGLAEFREYKIDSQAFRSEIVLRDTSNNVVGSLYLAGKKFSLLILIDRDSFGLATKISAFDVTGKLVWSNTIDTSDTAKLFIEREILQKNDSRFKILVGVCENNIQAQTLDEKNLARNLAFGPAMSESYYGWYSNADSPADFWVAHTYLNDLGLDYALEDYENHAMRVSEVLLSGAGKNFIGIAPFGLQACGDFPHINRIWPQVQADERLRVVNASFVHEVDEKTCLESVKNHPILNDDRVLWVVAAGNDGATQPSTCPQYLSGTPNMILVGATENGHLHQISNKGKNFVDIAALGSGSNNGFGTSFAAPRVSALAAEIFATYPELNAYQVKMSLMLGAKSVNSWLLDVRSGGEIQNMPSLAYAKQIAHGASYEEAIDAVECPEESKCDKYYKKLKLYNQFKNEENL